MNLNRSDINAMIAKIKRFAENDALRIAANVVKEQEVRQTEVGRDYKGQLFAPYKKSTVRARQRLGLRTDRVNLYVSGTLRNSRYYDSTNKELRYGYVTEDVAGYLQDGTDKMKGREFVGVSPMDFPEIEQRISIAVEKIF